MKYARARYIDTSMEWTVVRLHKTRCAMLAVFAQSGVRCAGAQWHEGAPFFESHVCQPKDARDGGHHTHCPPGTYATGVGARHVAVSPVRTPCCHTIAVLLLLRRQLATALAIMLCAFDP